MTGLTDDRGMSLSGSLIYATPAGRRGFVIFTGREDGSEPFRPVLRSSADGPLVHLAYLDADGSEPDLRTAEYIWIAPAGLTVVGVLPRAQATDEDEEADDEADCSHASTRPAEEGEPYSRECNDCAARLYLTEEQDRALRARDDAAYWVTSLDGTMTYAGPFSTFEDADDAAQQVEDDNSGLIVTDIRFECR